MHPVLLKTFGGLSPKYYFRQLFFSSLVFAFFIYMALHSPHPTPLSAWLFMTLSFLLYPYSRFVYESVVGFIMGDNIFFLNAIVMLLAKLFTILMCWGLAIFVAPVGLAYLYYHHSKA
jgi:hypothetical protein